MVFLKKENRIYFSPPGGIGRRTGLKILRIAKSVPVQVRGRAPFLANSLLFLKIKEHYQVTQSDHAKNLIENWEKEKLLFWQVIPEEMIDKFENPVLVEEIKMA